MKRLYPVEIIRKGATKRIGLSNMLGCACYRDVLAGGDQEEILLWLKELNVEPKFLVVIEGKTYVLVNERPINLFGES